VALETDPRQAELVTQDVANDVGVSPNGESSGEDFIVGETASIRTTGPGVHGFAGAVAFNLLAACSFVSRMVLLPKNTNRSNLPPRFPRTSLSGMASANGR
jgi:hypothetical protein